jgi:hypothetical protein
MTDLKISQLPTAGPLTGLEFLALAQAGTSVKTTLASITNGVNVLSYGADPTGATDSTAAFIGAAVASMVVLIPPGTYKLTAGLMSFSNGPRFVGAGRGAVTLRCLSGTADLLGFMAGFSGGGLSGVTINGSGMTGGNLLSVIGSARTRFDDISITGGFNGMYVQDQNVCEIGQMWMNGLVGTYGLKYFGGGTGAAQVLNIGKLEVGFSTNIVSSPIGFLIDGDADTVNADTYACTKGSVGLQIQNTGNLVNGPAFVTVLNYQSDFAFTAGLSISGGVSSGASRSHNFGSVYCQGCVNGPGVTIDQFVQNATFLGGQINNNHAQGVLVDGRYIKLIGLQVASNSAAGSASFPGIEIAAHSLGCTVIGGLAGQWVGNATNNQSYGVQTDVGANDYSILGVDLRNNVTADYLDNAASTTSVIFGNIQSSTTPHIVSAPIQAQVGQNLTLNGSGTNSVILGNKTNGVAFTAQAADASTVNHLKAFGHSTGGAPALAASGTDTDINVALIPQGAGKVQYGSAGCFSANGAVATSLGSIGPAGAGTTVAKWLTIVDNSGTTRYIPCF